jgi:hypothetical protein
VGFDMSKDSDTVYFSYRPWVFREFSSHFLTFLNTALNHGKTRCINFSSLFLATFFHVFLIPFPPFFENSVANPDDFGPDPDPALHKRFATRNFC